MKWISLSLQSMNLTSVGKQMFVNIKNITLFMELIVNKNTKNSYLPKLMILMSKLRPTLKMTKRALEHQAMPNSLLHWVEPNNSKNNTQLLKIFQTTNSQKNTITEISMDMISLVTSEIKVIVDHATPFLSPKLWKQE